MIPETKIEAVSGASLKGLVGGDNSVLKMMRPILNSIDQGEFVMINLGQVDIEINMPYKKHVTKTIKTDTEFIKDREHALHKVLDEFESHCTRGLASCKIGFLGLNPPTTGSLTRIANTVIKSPEMLNDPDMSYKNRMSSYQKFDAMLQKVCTQRGVPFSSGFNNAVEDGQLISACDDTDTHHVNKDDSICANALYVKPFSNLLSQMEASRSQNS